METLKTNNQSATAVQNVQGRLADDGEILIKFPSAVFEYYKKKEKYKDSFTEDGWYYTNFIGRYEANAFVIKNQKEIKAGQSVNENLISKDIKMMIEGKCHYLSSSIIVGADSDYPVAIVFPNNQMNEPQYQISPLDGCFCPKDMNELNKCLTGCLNDANCAIGEKFSKMKAFLIVEGEYFTVKSE